MERSSTKSVPCYMIAIYLNFNGLKPLLTPYTSRIGLGHAPLGKQRLSSSSTDANQILGIFIHGGVKSEYTTPPAPS